MIDPQSKWYTSSVLSFMLLFKAIIHKEAQECTLVSMCLKAVVLFALSHVHTNPSDCSSYSTDSSSSLPYTKSYTVSLKFPMPLPPAYSNTALVKTLSIFRGLFQ